MTGSADDTILIVDDAPANLAVLTASLGGRGFPVAIAEDGEEALLRASLVQPRLILLDVMLPGLDGYEVCRRLKADARTRDIPVIFMTALTDPEDKVRGFEAGGVDFLTKPLQLDEVTARARTHLKLHALQRQLEEKNAHLHQYQAQLEQLVALRTAELHDSNERYREIFDNVSDCIYLLEVVDDGRFRFIKVNRSVEKLLGLTKEQIVGRDVEQIFPESQAQDVIGRLRRCVTAGKQIDLELQLVLPSGLHVFHADFIPLRDAGGRICRLVSIARNITIRKQHEQVLQERMALESKLQKFAEVAPGVMGTYHMSRAGKVRMAYASPKLEEVTGFRRDEVMRDALSTARSIHPDDVAAHFASIQKSARTLAPWHDEFRVQHPEKGELWIEGKSIPERQPDGGILWYGFMHDITQRKRAEIQLHLSEQKYRALAENIPDLIFRYDRHCRRLYVNPAVERTFGKTFAQLRGQTPTESLVASASAGEHQQRHVQQVLDTECAIYGVLWSGEIMGVERTFDMSFVPEFGSDGEVASVLATSRDVGRLVAAERRIEQSQAQLRLLIAQRETVRDEERKHIARELHDELGQSLTALRMQVSLLRMQFADDCPALVPHLRNMTALVDRNIQTVRDVASALRPAALDMGVAPALEWLVEEFAKNTGIVCALEVADEDEAPGEEVGMAIFRMVQESLTNVARHAEATRVTVALRRQDGHYLLQVSDDGKGFDPARVGKKSLGLVGLRERARLFGGEVRIASTAQQGTTLEARIPLPATAEAP